MSAKIRAAVIGCGVIAPTHIESYTRLPDVELTWLCDLELSKAEALAKKYGGSVRCTTRAEEIFAAADVDVVSICTDHASHSALVIAALRAGKHVVCEKALSSSFAGLDAMIAEHKNHPQLVFSGIFQHRFDPPVQVLRQLVQSGELGQILTAGVHAHCVRTNEYYQSDAWRGTWEFEGGSVLINQAIHFIDSLCWVMGGVQSLCGRYENKTHQGVIDTEDTAVAALRFNNGAIGTLEATCSSHINWEATLFVHGTDGSIEIRDGMPLKVLSRTEGKADEWQKAFASAREARQIAAGADHYGFAHPAQIADVIEAIRQKRPAFVTGESAAHTNAVVLSVYQSCNEGRWVDLRHSI